MRVSIREARPSDTAACSRICYEAFKTFHEKHRFPPIFASLDLVKHRVGSLIDDPGIFALVAESDGRVVGSSFMTESDTVRGIGPITIDPAAQGLGAGRALMQAALARAAGHPVRLLQETFNMQSLSLYASLGFDCRAIYLVMAGEPHGTLPPGYRVRRMAADDLPACDALLARITGFSRVNELRQRLTTAAPVVATLNNEVKAYLCAPSAWLGSHGAAENEEALQALILGATREPGAPVAFLMPMHEHRLFRWALSAGLKPARPFTLMTIGAYEEPRGIYLPSVVY